MEIFKGVSPGFWSKNRTFYHGFGQKIEFFYHVCFLAKLSKKRSFFDILNKQDCFLDQKNRVLEKCKRLRFCKGVSLCLLSNNEIFLLCGFFLADQFGKEPVFIFWIKKNAF